jgi:hypothetical protein
VDVGELGGEVAERAAAAAAVRVLLGEEAVEDGREAFERRGPVGGREVVEEALPLVGEPAVDDRVTEVLLARKW